MGKKLDLNGKVFGRLTVIREILERNGQGAVKWECLCECGNATNVDGYKLVSGHTTSCNCYRREQIKTSATKHGLCGHPLYKVWNSMIMRCTNLNDKAYVNYGGRGIGVIDRWLESFEAFYKDVVHGYEKGLQLDRIDNDLGYTPENIRWVTREQNQMNKGSRKNSSSKYKGVTWDSTLSKWCVRIVKDYKRTHLGYFTSEGEAALAYNEAAKELFGEYAYLNKIETN